MDLLGTECFFSEIFSNQITEEFNLKPNPVNPVRPIKLDCGVGNPFLFVYLFQFYGFTVHMQFMSKITINYKNSPSLDQFPKLRFQIPILVLISAEHRCSRDWDKTQYAHHIQ